MPLRVKSRVCPTVEIYWGFDKYENEELLKNYHDDDVWFHVDKHSSAHVYTRLGSGLSFDTMPEELIREAAQVTKCYSIEGHKLSSVVVVYTPARNLLKDGSMEVGEVGFRNSKLVRRVCVEGKDRELLRYFKRTVVEDRDTDLRQEKIDREKEARANEWALKAQAERLAKLERE